MAKDNEQPAEGAEPEGETFDQSEALDQLQAEAEREEGQTAEGEYIGAGEDETANQGPDMSSKDVAKLLASTTFSLVAARKGAHWDLEDGEADQLGEAYGALMDKYLPEDTAGPELTAVLCTAIVVFPRVQQDRAGEGGQA
jgi:hypothetical protein